MTHPYAVHGVAYAVSGIPTYTPALENFPHDARHWPFIGSVVDYLAERSAPRGALPAVPRNIGLLLQRYVHAPLPALAQPAVVPCPRRARRPLLRLLLPLLPLRRGCRHRCGGWCFVVTRSVAGRRSLLTVSFPPIAPAAVSPVVLRPWCGRPHPGPDPRLVPQPPEQPDLGLLEDLELGIVLIHPELIQSGVLRLVEVIHANGSVSAP